MRTHIEFLAISLALGAPLAVAATAAAEDVGTQTSGVVYGSDDRADVYDFDGDRTFIDRARQSTVSLFSATTIDAQNLRSVSINASSYAQSQNLCASEPFREQPAGAYCSGTLIAPDLVLTAGHCMASLDEQCPYVRVLFNYSMASATQLSPINEDDFYACQRVITQSYNSGTGTQRSEDWAVFQLDRPVEGDHLPAPVRASRNTLPVGRELVMIGSPSGIPQKIEDGGRVRDGRASTVDYFVATTDSYGGNSGSGVYDELTGEVVGILVSGDTDFVEQGSCRVTNYCAEDGCGGENVMYAFRAIDDLCSVATDEDLCGTSPVCGDGFCAHDESCSADCGSAVCGNEVCELGELEGCSADCALQPPAAWTCADRAYGDLGTCHEDCGAPDPDCNFVDDSVLSSAADLFGCSVTKRGPSVPLGFALTLLGLVGFRRRRASLDA